MGLESTHLVLKSKSLLKGKPMSFPRAELSFYIYFTKSWGAELGGRVGEKGLFGACMYGLYLHANRCEAGSEDGVKGVAYMFSIFLAQP